MDIVTDFRKYALSKGVSMSYLDDFLRNVEDSREVKNAYPGIIEERSSAMRMTEMNVFSRLMQDRIIYFSGEVNQDSVDTVIAQILYLSNVSKERDINMYINSGGGSVINGLALIDTMDFVPNAIRTTCIGMCASMGAVLLSNGLKGERSILKHGRVMIHSVSSGYEGHTKDIEIQVEQTKKCEKDVYSVLAKNLGKTYEEIETLCDRDNWFIGEEAVKLGIVDKVI